MNEHKKLLTLSDLYNFYSQKKKSMTFSAEKTGYNIAVQTDAKFEISDDLSEGLLYGKIRAFHDLTNNNKSHIETDILEEKMKSIKDRPIMADIVDTDKLDENGNFIKDFSGHTMEYDEKLGKMVYKELPVGHFVNPESIHTEYDKEYDRNFVVSDIVIYEEYTDACEILRRRKTVDCSVELCIRSMHWDCTEGVLYLDDFYVQGCTLLGESVLPGMSGSKVTLKDFSEENNSMFTNFSETEHSKLIETLDKLNSTLSVLSNFNIQNNFMKGGDVENMSILEELLTKYNKTVEDITFEYENLSDDKLLAKFEEVFGKCGDDDKKEKCEEDPDDNADDPNDLNDPNDDPDDLEDDDHVKENNACDPNKKKKCEEEEPDYIAKDDNACGGGSDSKKKKNNSQDDGITRTYELSHDDIRCALYNLLAPYEETDNDYYWIMEVFDSYFVYQGCTGKVYGQKYSKDGDNIAFDGERYELFMEYLTESEKTELESMRSNYSSISEKLAQYEEAEEIADKMTVFADEAYSNYLDTDEFKSLMDKEIVKKFTKEELSEKADAALGKLVKTTKTFSTNSDKNDEKEKSPSFFAFSRIEQNTSFLDGLLKK